MHFSFTNYIRLMTKPEIKKNDRQYFDGHLYFLQKLYFLF